MAGVAGFGDARRQTERVSSHANLEVRRVLPADARVWVHNSAPANQALVNDIIDNMTSSFIRGGITIIERESIALIMDEQNFQMSGFVSDNDFVRIGNLAGANTIVIVNITGTGDMRRLQVRVLDIERGVTTMQSDTSDAWKI
jgi:hypothetical protein